MKRRSATPQNMQDWITRLREAGELCEVTVEVDPFLEITEITDRVSKQSGPALLFSNVRGSNMPVITNQFGSAKRLAMAFGVSDIDEVGLRIEELLDLAKPPKGFGGKLSMLRKLAKTARSVPPYYVKSAACQQVVKTGSEVDLDALPILTCWPEDGGPYVTLPLVFSKDTNGVRNVGMYRLQKYDQRTCGMHWQIHKDAADDWRNMPPDGKLEVAVAIGSEPIITYAASSPLPKDIDEMLFAGFARQKRVPMVQCKTVDVQVPAEAEIILEGYVMQGELREEGPFGDHTGYYSLADDYPVFHVTAVTHRKDPTYAATIVGVPNHEDKWMGKATERIFLPLLRMVQHEIVDYDLPSEGVFHGCCIVSIDKKFPAHAKKIMHAVWGTALLSLTKCVIVVDSDVDVHDYAQVAIAMARHFEPDRDCLFSEGPLDVLDHAPTHMGFGGKLGVDATRAWQSEARVDRIEKHLDRARVENAFAARSEVRATNVIPELHFVVASLEKSRPEQVDDLIQGVSYALDNVKVLVIVDDYVDVSDLAHVAFRAFGNTDFVRDCMVAKGEGHPLVIDATTKLFSEGYERDWPSDIVMSEAIKQRVDERWAEYKIPTSGARTWPHEGLAEGERRIGANDTARGVLAGNAQMVKDKRSN